MRNAGVPAWSAEDYSTYSDATGAGCWGRLLVQNMGWDLSATISWYLLGSFARGMDYDSDGSETPCCSRLAPPYSSYWHPPLPLPSLALLDIVLQL